MVTFKREAARGAVKAPEPPGKCGRVSRAWTVQDSGRPEPGVAVFWEGP